MTSPITPLRKVSESKESLLFLKTCEKILAFLDRARLLSEAEQKKARVIQISPGSLQIRKELDCGLELVGESRAPKSATLQIFCDPPRFEKWRDRQGNLDLFYANPYGIEIVYQRGSWGFFIDEQRVPLLLQKEPYLAAQLGISLNPNGTEVYFLKLGETNESSPAQGSTTPSLSSVSVPRTLLDSERGIHAGQPSSSLERLLEAMA